MKAQLKSVPKSAVKTVAKPAAKPAPKPAPKAVAKPAPKAVSKPVAKAAKKPLKTAALVNRGKVSTVSAPRSIVKAPSVSLLNAELTEARAYIAAINKAQAVIEFTLDGSILTANDNFLNTVGYRIDEIRGQHHGLFVEPAYRASPEYRAFWEKLARGEFDAGQYKRIGKGGAEVWIQASYNPILDPSGRPFKVVKYATDITEAKLKAAIYESQLDAISKTQAVIKFTLDGKIVDQLEDFAERAGLGIDAARRRLSPLFDQALYQGRFTPARLRLRYDALNASGHIQSRSGYCVAAKRVGCSAPVSTGTSLKDTSLAERNFFDEPLRDPRPLRRLPGSGAGGRADVPHRPGLLSAFGRPRR